jgi:CPA2 family monovalent cation:H+ antiporter-2
MASEGLGSYKQALAQAYEDELDGVENVVWAARARYRAARFALYQRTPRRAQSANAGALSAVKPDLEDDPVDTPPEPAA